MTIQTPGGFVLRPVPIKKADYMATLQAKGLPGSEAAKAHLELARIHEVVEAFSGYFNPLQRGNRVLWEVRFPAKSKWKSGPPMVEGPLAALHANYRLNKFYAGFMTDRQQNPHLLLEADKLADEATLRQRTRDEENAHEDALRQQGVEPRVSLYLGRPEPD